MANKGTVYLIPNVIADNTSDKVIPPVVREILPSVTVFLCENIRSARRYLSGLKIYDSIEKLEMFVLDKDTSDAATAEMMQPVLGGRSVGIISESGCPGVADPGSRAVLFAHRHDIRVIPLTGPSSILLALMASGLNGQRFAFHGYLPVGRGEAASAIRQLEKESRQKNQTQIFIETPYRTSQLAELLVRTLGPETLLTIAIDVTSPSERIVTKPAGQWKKELSSLPRSPAVFLFLASS